MFDFLKKNLNIKISISLVFLIFIFAAVTSISCNGSFGIIQNQLVTGKINNIAASPVKNEDINSNENFDENGKDNSGESGDIGLGDIVMDKNIPGGNAGMESPEEEIIKEDVTEGQEQSGSEERTEINNDTGQNDSPGIDFSNSDDFRIEVDLNKQEVFVFYKDNLIKEMICSGGTAEKPTPKGEFKTTRKGEWFFSDKYGMGAYHWIRFLNDYLFHSVPYYEGGQMIIEEEYDKLGSPASYGCIRLKPDEAEWLYEKLPLGVKVSIY